MDNKKPKEIEEYIKEIEDSHKKLDDNAQEIKNNLLSHYLWVTSLLDKLNSHKKMISKLGEYLYYFLSENDGEYTFSVEQRLENYRNPTKLEIIGKENDDGSLTIRFELVDIENLNEEDKNE